MPHLPTNSQPRVNWYATFANWYNIFVFYFLLLCTFFLHHIYPEKICVNLMFRAVCRTHLQNNPDYRWFYEEKEERDSQVPRRWSV